MSALLSRHRAYVVGIGLHRYQFPTDTPYIQLGLTAVREALLDAGIEWPRIEAAFVGSAALGMAAGRVMFRHLGSTGLEVAQVENASASGSTAFRMACLAVASGERDVALAVGIDKFGDGRRASLKSGLPVLSPSSHVAMIKFGLFARQCCRERGIRPEDMAAVAVKNHGNAALNPYAQFRKPRTLEQVLNSPKLAGDLTVMQCCPRGEGAAAAIVVSEAGLERLKVSRSRAIAVLSSTSASEKLPDEHHGAYGPSAVVDLVGSTAAAALEQAGIGAKELDIVELHDAFSIEELMYSEAIGVCDVGEGAAYLARGASKIGGQCAINPSGGLIGMGHPLGPTGIGQIAEITRQLRGEANGRQHPGARLALAHMIGVGSIAVCHVLGHA